MEKEIRMLRIHPAIGIARLGNSPNGIFIGPEIHGVHPDPNEYRDRKQCLKRQAARFRLFAFDANDDVIGEINCADPRVKSIRWTVHLRNTKAAGRRFEGILRQGAPRRNKVFNKRVLVLDPGEHTIEAFYGYPAASDKTPADRRSLSKTKVDMFCTAFMKREFPDPLKLGTLLTDDAGRLVVLGGHGESGSLVGASLNEADDAFSFANHDGWYDDTSDGYIRASVSWDPSFKNAPSDPQPSWVIVAPPKYAPSLESVITLYDVLYEKAIRDKRLGAWMESKWLKTVLERPARPSFTKHIYPILRRAYEMGWVFARAEVGHQNELDFTQLSNETVRQHIFRQLREPSDNPKKPGSGMGEMPYIWSDLFLMNDSTDNPHPVNATLTRHQYETMKMWASGQFEDDWNGLAIAAQGITPEGLDRAALDACVGAAFFPGIETSFHIRDKFHYIEPFRLDASRIVPGEVTQQMSVPWQSDFVDCSDGDAPFAWWPAQRPIDVRVPSENKDAQIVRWARHFDGNPEDITAGEMVHEWWQLGLLRQVPDGLVETNRVSAKPSAVRKRRKRKNRNS